MSKKWIIEELYAATVAALFVASEPLSLKKLSDLLESKETDILTAVKAIQPQDCRLGLLVQHTGKEMQLVTNPAYASCVKRVVEDDSKRELTPAAKETLAIIAYKQPVCRAEIEKIRGLDCRKILDNLVKKGLIQVARIKDEGDTRSNYYEVSLGFLEYFGLSSADDLISHLHSNTNSL